MDEKFTASFEVTNWDENAFDEGPGLGKLTSAKVTKKYSGDITGESITEWLMAYSEDGSATFVGIERIKGAVRGRNGTFVLQHTGRYADGAAKATLQVVPNSGSGELAGVAGSGDFLADPNGKVNLQLNLA
jgi:hypothetical protein